MLAKFSPFTGMQLRVGAELLPDQPDSAEECTNCKFPAGYLEPWDTPGEDELDTDVANLTAAHYVPAQFSTTPSAAEWHTWTTADAWTPDDATRFGPARAIQAIAPFPETEGFRTFLEPTLGGAPQAPKLLTVGEAGTGYPVGATVSAPMPAWYSRAGRSHRRPLNFTAQVSALSDSHSVGGALLPLRVPLWRRTGSQDYSTGLPRVYVYTWVNEAGWESAPSLVSPHHAWDDTRSEDLASLVPDGASVTVTYGSNPTAGSSGIRKRLYRSVAGLGQAAFRFVAEVSGGDRTTTDDKPDAELGALLYTQTWLPIPIDVNGLAVWGNRMVSWRDKEVFFSVQGTMHAWPATNYRAIQHNVVRCVEIGGALVILTDGPPYIAIGSNPATMNFIALPNDDLACTNPASVVSANSVVLYATQRGIAAITLKRTAEIPTLAIASVEGWREWVDPTTIQARLHRGRYVASATMLKTPSAAGFCYDPVLSSFTELDLSVLPGALVFSDGDDAYAIDGGNNIKKIEGGSTKAPAKWRSKRFVLPAPSRFSTVKAMLDDADPDATLKLKVNDVANRSNPPGPELTVKHNTVTRFAANTRTWELQLDVTETRETVKRVYVCESPGELRGQL